MWMVQSLQAGPPLFGQFGRLEWELALPIGATLGAIALGFWVIYRVKRWREELVQDEPGAPKELLDHYQQMVDDGLLDPQEFAKIKAQMDKQPNTPPNESDPPPSTTQPPDNSIFEK
jgi:hypothetical protein